MTNVRQALRAATQTAHTMLETTMALDPATLTRDHYGRTLQVLHAVRAGWEPALGLFLVEACGPHLGWLATDLDTLGLQPIGPAPAPRIDTAAAAWGTLYVLEGSALGGRSMLRGLAALGFTPEHGARYFAGRGAETGAHWSAFLARLEAQDERSTPLIVEAALAAFANLASAARGHLITGSANSLR